MLRSPLLSLLLAAMATVLFQPIASYANNPNTTIVRTSLTPEKENDLFSSLDLSLPELTSVQQAVSNGDRAAARHALAQWLRTRTTKTSRITPQRAPWPNETASANDTERANAALEGRVYGGFVEIEATFPDNRINWRHNETHVRNSNGENIAKNPEWQWQLNRMFFWRNLANTYRATANEDYAQAWLQQFHDFVDQCPAPAAHENRGGSPWRTIEAGIRMSDAWPVAFHSFLQSPSVTDEDLLLFMHASLEHARYLKAYASAGNWLTMEMNGLFSIGAMFPEFSDAADWRSFAVNRLYSDIDFQFLPDGTHFELSPAYHNVALGNMVALPRLAKAVGRIDEIPDNYIKALESAYEYNLNAMTPDRSLPKFNDSWPVNIRSSLRNALDFFPEREDFQWISSNGNNGSAPNPLTQSSSRAFDYAGHYVMRSGWAPDANYAAFDAGPLGAGHWHQDKLNLIIYAYGRELLFDNGGGSYENSPWRRYGLSSHSHNVVLMDGKSQHIASPVHTRFENVSRIPLEAGWESTPEYDYVSGIYYDGYGDDKSAPIMATHIRRVYFHKPDVFVVVDTLFPADSAEHSWEARWHLLTTETQHDPESGIVVSTDSGLANLAIIPLVTDGLEVNAVSAQIEPEILGWDVRKDTTPQLVPATTVLHKRSGSGPQSFVTLLLPLDKTQTASAPAVASVKAAAESTRLLVELHDGRKLEIDPGAAPDARITVSEQQ